MAFSYIGSAETVASRTLPWGIALIVVGIGFAAYRIRREKSYIYLLAGIAFMFAGALISYPSILLKRNPGTWEIQVDEQRIQWKSPHEVIDHSFEIGLSQINHVLVENWIDVSEPRARYTIVTDNEKIPLSAMSGVDLEKFTDALVTTGIERKDVSIDKPK